MTDDTAATMRFTPDESGPMLPLCLGGRYRLTERIGFGGMATIYRAYDEHFERTVAVKLMTTKLRTDPEFDARFRREALIVSKLNDPHIVVVHDFGLDVDHGPFLVMELLEGETLRERLNSSGPLSVPAAIQLGEQIMLALAHAHEHGVIHRDLKPDNVFLLAQSGVRLHVRVLDFGIARMIRNPNQTDRPTETPRGTAVGTPRYMAPEQLAGKSASARSDLYSASVVLYEALTGGVPELMGPRLRERCPAAPEGLVRLIEQSLSSNPDERPISATEAYLQLHELSRVVRGDLLVSDAAVAQLTARFRDHAPATSQSPTRRLWLAACIALLLTLIPLAWMLSPRYHPVPDQESIAGIKLGDHRDDVVAKFGKPSPGSAESLRPFLNEQDVIRPGDAAAPEVLSWTNKGIHVVIANDKVRAVVARQSAATGRDLRIGNSEAALRKAYPEVPTSARIVGDDGILVDWATMYRYAKHQLGVEIGAGKVTAIAIWE
jgi:serine/threonine protein kinase